MQKKLLKHRNRILIYTVLIAIVNAIARGGVTEFYQPIVDLIVIAGLTVTIILTLVKTESESFYGFIDTFSVIWSFFFVFYTIISFIIFPARVNGSSMMPNFTHSDIIFVWKIGDEFELGDVVFVNVTEERTNYDHDDYFLKRVIGTPGDTVYFENNTLYINGEMVEEEYIDSSRNRTNDFLFEDICFIKDEKCSGVIPEDYYFVLGDNRDNSQDSRAIGLIYKDDLFGRVIFNMMRFQIW